MSNLSEIQEAANLVTDNIENLDNRIMDKINDLWTAINILIQRIERIEKCAQ